MNPYLWVGLPGLATDIQTVRQSSNYPPLNPKNLQKTKIQVKQKIEFRMNMYELKESRQMKPKTFANMVGCLSHRVS